MRLLEWCKSNDVPLSQVGDDLGIKNRQTMWKYAHGKIKATPKLIADCEEYTKGEVKATDWVFPESDEVAA